MRTPTPPRDAHREPSKGTPSGEVQAFLWAILPSNELRISKKILKKPLTNPPDRDIIRPSKGDDPVGTGERERAGRDGSQSQKLKRLGAATEEWRVAVPHKGADDPTEMAGSLVYRTPKGILGTGETRGASRDPLKRTAEESVPQDPMCHPYGWLPAGRKSAADVEKM
jgi:hypothetical protein